jgi:hypothetical protein
MQHQHHQPPRIVYNDLCNFPKTSNYGSMKKKKNRDRVLQQHEQQQQQQLQQLQHQEEETYIPGHRFEYGGNGDGIYSA